MCERELKLLFSCENAQEYRDINLLMQELVKESNAEVMYFNLTSASGISTKEGYGDDGLFTEYNAVRIFNKVLRDLSPLLRLITSFIIALQILWICKTRKIDRVVIGAPLLPYRIARMLSFGTVHYISIIRGIIAQSTEKTSLSSRIFIRYQRLAKFNWLRKILSDYYADTVICTGEVTEEFLISRYVPKNNIRIIGSIYSDYYAKTLSNSTFAQAGNKSVVFITSAFEWHGDVAAQQAQIGLVSEVKNYLESIEGVECGFIVRKHPRESLDAYALEENLTSCVDISDGDPFEVYPPNALFISTVSTLIFELLSQGRYARLVADDFFLNHYRCWYESVGITPVTEWRSLIDDYFVNDGFLLEDGLGRVISSKYKGHVVEECVRVILNVSKEIMDSKK